MSSPVENSNAGTGDRNHRVSVASNSGAIQPLRRGNILRSNNAPAQQSTSSGPTNRQNRVPIQPPVSQPSQNSTSGGQQAFGINPGPLNLNNQIANNANINRPDTRLAIDPVLRNMHDCAQQCRTEMFKLFCTVLYNLNPQAKHVGHLEEPVQFDVCIQNMLPDVSFENLSRWTQVYGRRLDWETISDIQATEISVNQKLFTINSQGNSRESYIQLFTDFKQILWPYCGRMGKRLALTDEQLKMFPKKEDIADPLRIFHCMAFNLEPADMETRLRLFLQTFHVQNMRRVFSFHHVTLCRLAQRLKDTLDAYAHAPIAGSERDEPEAEVAATDNTHAPTDTTRDETEVPVASPVDPTEENDDDDDDDEPPSRPGVRLRLRSSRSSPTTPTPAPTTGPATRGSKRKSLQNTNNEQVSATFCNAELSANMCFSPKRLVVSSRETRRTKEAFGTKECGFDKYMTVSC